MNITLPPDGHHATHAADLFIPLDEALRLISARIPVDAPLHTPFCVVARTTEPLGTSRCVPTAGKHAWWDYRPGRPTPSRFVAGNPVPVAVLTAWLRRESAETATLLTLYPGEPAPREVHDPELRELERHDSHEFWGTHALIASPPRAIWLVNALSLNMFGRLAEGAVASFHVQRVPVAHARVLAAAAVSAVGHDDTASLFTDVLRQEVVGARTTLALEGGERLLAGQYVGERLPLGARTLPTGSTILWYWVTLEPIST